MPWPRIEPRHTLIAAGVIFVLVSLVAGPMPPQNASDSWHVRVGPIYLGRPIVASGDSPHYLLIVHSLIEDFDIDLANNQRQVREGDWDAGTRFRGTRFGGHVDVDREGRFLTCHPPALPLILASFVWPLRGTEWVESACIYLTLLWTFLGIYWFVKWKPEHAAWGLVLAIGTPLLCYGRDIWTEAWQATIWVLLLSVTSLPLLAVVVVAGVWIKYQFAVVPVVMGLTAFWSGERRRGVVLCGSGVVAVLIAIVFSQIMFSETDHFDLFHMAYHPGVEAYNEVATVSGQGSRTTGRGLMNLIRSFGGGWTGGWGLLFSSADGLLPFFPFLVWGFWSFRKGGQIYLPAIAFFMLHAMYGGWRGGFSFSARYMVPMLPILVLGVAEARLRFRWAFGICFIISLFWGLMAGVLPVAVMGRGPLDTLTFLAAEVWG